MSEELEKTVIETVSTFSEKLIEAAGVVSTKLIEVAPDVADAMLSLVQIKGLWEVTTGLVYLMIFLTPLFFSKRIWSKVCAYESNQDCYRTGGAYVFFVLGFGALSILSFIRLTVLLDFYNWISIFFPEGAIALRALSSVGVEL
tara:strand:- start:5552 stop:5983 length:432 start_codon:yes stop_codon:yes gene_type:complete